MRPPMLVVLVVTSLLVDLNVIASAEPETNLLIDEQAHNSTGANRRGLLCQSAELLDEYCALTSSAGRPVCASDGRLYASECELARASCQLDELKLCRVTDESWCSSKQAQQSGPDWCSHKAYQLFKLALWREFNSSATLLFDHLDRDRDGRLCARELWPTLSARDYNDDDDDFGVDLETTSACDPTTTTTAARSQLSEFAFERHFQWSPCSLSHLLVFEAGRPDSSSSAWRQLTRAEFVRLFDKLEQPDGQSHNERAAITQSEVIMQMGESKLIDCLPDGRSQPEGQHHCAWTRHGVNLASIKNSEPHVSIVNGGDDNQPKLRLIDAQLYLSGVYRCTCYGGHSTEFRKSHANHHIHLIRAQVLAQPRVSVRPKFQWSLPGSRVAFECQHEQIDTSNFDYQPRQVQKDQIGWLHNKRHISSSGNSTSSQAQLAAGGRHRLVLEQVQLSDSGQYTCQVNASSVQLGEGSSRLLIQDQPVSSDGFQDTTTTMAADRGASLLWSFHEAGVSVFKLQVPEDGQQLELVHEMSGRSRVSEHVDGNWNQLTLCGGLTPEQVVICEWSDNAILVEVAQTGALSSGQRKYIYIGQPNLNRVLVFDGHAGELLAVVATEPQPRRLFAFKPNKIHLSKWVRRRLGPLASMRWLQALEYRHQQQQQLAASVNHHHLQSQAHPLRMTPKSSRLYSDRVEEQTGRGEAESEPPNASALDNGNSSNDDDDREDQAERDNNVRGRFRRHLVAGQQRARAWAAGSEQTNANDRASSTPPLPPTRLVQYDIWLLCYGKPLLVDAQSDSSDLPAPLETDEENLIDDQQEARDHQRHRINRRQRVKDDRSGGGPTKHALHNQTSERPRAFTPWPHWNSLSPRSKEARLRNRKSVQIIQSTFLPTTGRARSPHHQQQRGQINESAGSLSSGSQTLNEFKRLTVLTTHHVIAGRLPPTAYNEDVLARGHGATPLMGPPGPPTGIDLVQDLCVPERPMSQAANAKFKLHHAYVTHYAERQLYRVAMDSYRYDREIDLHQCDPLALVPAPQGLLIIQCRAPITHQLNGQLVLDELTSARVQFNTQIKAQQAHLTPDSRYLVSILANDLSGRRAKTSWPENTRTHIDDNTRPGAKQNHQQSSVIYVQSVRVGGLEFMYEIKTSLELIQCSFVWRDGYYAAIFVALNRRGDRPTTELLSLRLADGRLELIVRVPGLAWSPTARHREPLNVNQELQVASLSTNEGLYLVDLEENRVIQGVHDHNHRSGPQSSLPTLLWV